MTDTGTLRVRPAGAQDVQAALAVLRAAGAAVGRRLSTAELERTEAELTAPEAVVVVVDAPGRAAAGLGAAEEVGSVAAAGGAAHGGAADRPQVVAVAHGRLEADQVRLVRLVVAPGSRRRGTGGALLEGFADEAWRRGARRLVTTVPADDAAALAFLTSAGLGPGEPPEPPGGRATAGAAGAAGVVELAAELDPPVRELLLRERGLRLGQLLKLAGLADTGSQAKALLERGEVQVNGEVEQRRGRQLSDGDVVVARDQAVRVVAPGP